MTTIIIEHISAFSTFFIALLVMGNVAVALTVFIHQIGAGSDVSGRLYVLGALSQALAWVILHLAGMGQPGALVYAGSSAMLTGIALEAAAIAMIDRPARPVVRVFGPLTIAGVLVVIATVRSPLTRAVVPQLAAVPLFVALALLLVTSPRCNPMRMLSAVIVVLHATLIASPALVVIPSFRSVGTVAWAQLLVYFSSAILSFMGAVAYLLLSWDLVRHRLAESEHKYRSVVELASEGIIVVQDGKLALANRSFWQLARQEPDGHDDLRVEPFIWPEDRARAMANHATRMRGDSPPLSYEIRLIMPDGSPRWVSLSTASIAWDGRPAGLVLLTDIDDRKQATARIEHLLQEKNLLLREVHHRVKNNLNLVMSMLSLQTMTSTGRDPGAVLDDARNRIQSIGGLYEILNARATYDRGDAPSFIVQLLKEIRSVLDRENRVAFNVDIADVEIGVDRLATMGILVNELVTNAYKHAFKGVAEPEITVRLLATGTTLKLVVADNGTGLYDNSTDARTDNDGATGAGPGSGAGSGPDRTAGMVSAADGAVAGDGSGAGLGSQLVSMLCEQLGATVSVVSPPGTRYVFEMSTTGV